MNKLFSPYPLWPEAGLAFVRIVIGLFMVYHGWEVFDEEKMKEYLTWESFKGFSSPAGFLYRHRFESNAKIDYLLRGHVGRRS